jgi:nitrogen fixation NifU-like protein
MMTEAVKGRDMAAAQALQQRFRAVLTGELEPEKRRAGQAGQPGRRAPLPGPHQVRAAGLARADARLAGQQDDGGTEESLS